MKANIETLSDIKIAIFNVSPNNFEQTALQVFQYQYRYNKLYQSYCNALKIVPGRIQRINQIPFLPISFFKTHKIFSGDKLPEFYFESSGTTQENTSKHFVADLDVYKNALVTGFEKFYGSSKNFTFLGLLPSYLERKNASLVYMVKTLMEISEKPHNGFFLNDFDKLKHTLLELTASNEKIFLFGVTFALLDFAEECPISLNGAIIMETGGMKGRKIEWTRPEVHNFLKKQFDLKEIHSEYGMTELLSQAYSQGEGIFECSHTMRILIREINDPLDVRTSGFGAINVIDIANINSCSFIATDDLANLKPDGSFEVLGRMDNSILRGCSLMAV